MVPTKYVLELCQSYHIPSKTTSLLFNPSLAETTCPVLANSVDPDQLASEAN